MAYFHSSSLNGGCSYTSEWRLTDDEYQALKHSDERNTELQNENQKLKEQIDDLRQDADEEIADLEEKLECAQDEASDLKNDNEWLTTQGDEQRKRFDELLEAFKRQEKAVDVLSDAIMNVFLAFKEHVKLLTLIKDSTGQEDSIENWDGFVQVQARHIRNALAECILVAKGESAE